MSYEVNTFIKIIVKYDIGDQFVRKYEIQNTFYRFIYTLFSQYDTTI